MVGILLSAFRMLRQRKLRTTKKAAAWRWQVIVLPDGREDRGLMIIGQSDTRQISIWLPVGFAS
jgi:hypothetical protein